MLLFLIVCILLLFCDWELVLCVFVEEVCLLVVCFEGLFLLERLLLIRGVKFVFKFEVCVYLGW